MYEETDTGLDLTATSGLFSVQVGSSLHASNRTTNDPDLTMAEVFANQGTLTGFGSCSYTPVAGDYRKMRVTVIPHSTGIPTALTPDQVITSVPQAQAAETLQGFVPSDFIQAASGVAGQSNVNLANLITLTGGGDASTLHNHDLRYVQLGSATPSNLGAGAYTIGGNFGIGTASPAGNLGFLGTTPQTIIVDRNTTAASPGSALTITAGGATSGSADQSGGNLVLSGGTSTGTGGSGIQFETASSGASGTTDSTPSTKMTLTSAGNLGVGTTTPLAQLEVDTAAASVIGEIIKGSASQSVDLFQVRDSTSAVLTKIDSTGMLTLKADPTSSLQAATKGYVDTAVTGTGDFKKDGSVAMTGALKWGATPSTATAPRAEA